MPILLLVCFVVLGAAAPALAKTTKKLEKRTVLLKSYAANVGGATYEVTLEGPSGKFAGQLVVHLTDKQKELARIVALELPNGKVAPAPLVPGRSGDSWAITPFGASDDEGPTVLRLTAFPLGDGERGLLVWRFRERMSPSSQVVVIGLRGSALKELWNETLPGRTHVLDAEVRSVDDEPELVLKETSLEIGQVTRYQVLAQDEETALFTRERAVFAVVVGPADAEEELPRVASSCKAFTGGKATLLLAGSSFPALRAAGGVAVALTTDSGQAREWVQELASCRKGTAPSVVRLR
jgi:hypothetical protein